MATIEAEEGSRVPSTPPRENLIRAMRGIELVRSEGDGMPTLTGYCAVWDQWTEIRSAAEGNFMERFAPGSFSKTIQEGQSRMRVLFNHGRDPQIGNKVLGPIRSLEEDDYGVRYEVELLDTSYNRDLIPGLDADVYGASIQFSVMQEERVARPAKSGFNPRGIQERTVTEARMPEFGPVTFPAYAGASAGLRSMTDEFLFDALVDDPERLRELCERAGIKLAGVATLPSTTGGVTINIADSSLLGVPPRGNTTLSTSNYGLNLINDSTQQPLEDEPRAEGEPEPPEATTPPAPTSEPEPSAATTRAKARPGGLYPNREEKPPWLL